MRKHPLLVLIAAGIISIAAPFATAQSSPADSQQPPSQDNGMRHRGGMDPAQRTQELTQKLKLSSDQQSKVQSIYESAKSQMESLHKDSSMSQEDRRSKMMEIHKNADAQVRDVLDSNQQKKFDEMQARREQRMQNGHQGPASDAGSGQQPPQ
jgi:periplasmic protein CpxP/Spy